MPSKGFVILIFLAIPLLARAQQDTWYSGAVVTTDSEVLVGEILYQQDYGLVVIREKGAQTANVITAVRLKSFRYYDSAFDINRKFITFGKQIFEEVLPGTIQVVRAAKQLALTTGDRDGFDYYFVRDNQLERLEKFRTKLYPDLAVMLIPEEKEFHLNPNRAADAIRYIQLYNRKFSHGNWATLGL